MVDYKPYFEKMKDIAANGSVQMCILKRTQSTKDEKKKQVLRVEVDHAVKKLFVDNLINSCDEIIDMDKLDFPDFFSGEDKDNSLLVIKQDDMHSIGTLFPIISQVQSETNTNFIKDFDDKILERLQSYAICIKKHREDKDESKELCIYFRKYSPGSKISKSKRLIVFKNGKFDELDGDVFKCDNQIDAIYYDSDLDHPDLENSKFMFVKRVTEFEDIFSFLGYYKQETQKSFELLTSNSNLDIGDGLLDEIIDKIKIIKRISRLNKSGFFDDLDITTVKMYYDKAAKEHILELEINDGKFSIQNKQSLNDFLDICENRFSEDLIDPTKIYRSSHSLPELPKR